MQPCLAGYWKEQAMADDLVADYLGRLNAAAWPLTQSRREELVSEVREHIESALAEAGTRDETTLRNVHERLGPPEDIVAAETEGGATEPGTWRAISHGTGELAARAQARGWGGLEIAAVVLLLAGSFFLWWIGPIIGIVLVWQSDRWDRHEKRVATAIVLGLLVVQVILLIGFFAFFMVPGPLAPGLWLGGLI
jgi:hypothetical protein